MILIRQATIMDIDQLAFLFDQYRVFYKKTSDPEGAKKFISDRFNKKESVMGCDCVDWAMQLKLFA